MIRIVRCLGVALAVLSPVVASAQSKAPHTQATYVVAPPQANAPKPTDVLTGFLDADGKARGRPAGVAIDRKCAWRGSDDGGNGIWRVSAR